MSGPSVPESAEPYQDGVTPPGEALRAGDGTGPEAAEAFAGAVEEAIEQRQERLDKLLNTLHVADIVVERIREDRARALTGQDLTEAFRLPPDKRPAWVPRLAVERLRWQDGTEFTIRAAGLGVHLTVKTTHGLKAHSWHPDSASAKAHTDELIRSFEAKSADDWRVPDDPDEQLELL